MSSKTCDHHVFCLLPRTRHFARMGICVLVSLIAALSAGIIDPNQALYAFLGGGLLVPNQYGSRPSIFAFVALLSPMASFCFLFSDHFTAGLEQDASFVIPRLVSRDAWTLGRLAQLVIFSASFAFLGRLASAIGLVALGCNVELSELLGVSFADALLGFALSLLLVLVTNCLAIKTDSIVAFSIVFAVHAAALVGVGNMPYEMSRAVAPWLLSTQGVLAWLRLDDGLWEWRRGLQRWRVFGLLVYGCCAHRVADHSPRAHLGCSLIGGPHARCDCSEPCDQDYSWSHSA